LPGLAEAEAENGEIAQLPDIDLHYDLCGVEAISHTEDGAVWQGWLPHLDMDVSREFSQDSADHARLWSQLERAGTLKLRTSLNLRDMLRPAIQPGSSIDYQWPAEEVTLTLESNCPLVATLDGQRAVSDGSSGSWRAQLTVPRTADDERHLLEVRLDHETRAEPLRLRVYYHTNEDDRPRALPLWRQLLPWSKSLGEPAEAVNNRMLPELAGGNWMRGRAEFFGDQAGCAKCHQIRGEGARVGPDLSNLPHRDYASVLRDISQPSFAINPDHTSQAIILSSGRVLTGTTRLEGDQLVITHQDASETSVDRSDIESIEPSSLSIMPEGIPELLGPDRLRDLLTFLLVEPPRMPVYGERAPPSPRTKAEVTRVLAGSHKEAPINPLHIALVAGPKDHGPGEHDYPAWQHTWQQLLDMAEGVRVTTADPWPTEAEFQAADVIVFYQKGDWTSERARDIDAFLERGGGLVYIHYAVDGGNDASGFAERIGLAWRGGRSKFRHGSLDVQFTKGSRHPIARNFDHVSFHDESYWQLVGDAKRIELLATGIEEEEPRPLFWTVERGGGRVFVSIPGHFAWTFDDPLFRVLLLRGIAWAAGEPVDRFNELVTPGARIAEPSGSE
jgi:putative heme-binding domain-containing protein